MGLFVPFELNIYRFRDKRKEIMDATEVVSSPAKTRNDTQFTLKWQDSEPVKRLFDAISVILAEEYIRAVKQNPEVFTKEGDKK